METSLDNKIKNLESEIKSIIKYADNSINSNIFHKCVEGFVNKYHNDTEVAFTTFNSGTITPAIKDGGIFPYYTYMCTNGKEYNGSNQKYFDCIQKAGYKKEDKLDIDLIVNTEEEAILLHLTDLKQYLLGFIRKHKLKDLTVDRACKDFHKLPFLFNLNVSLMYPTVAFRVLQLDIIKLQYLIEKERKAKNYLKSREYSEKEKKLENELADKLVILFDRRVPEVIRDFWKINNQLLKSDICQRMLKL